MSIDKNTVVTIGYKLFDEAGQLIEASPKDRPLEYLHGANNIIPGLESALTGKAVGDTLSVKIAPEEAYGQPNEALKQTVSKSAFVDVEKVEVGMQFQAQAANGQVEVVTVVAVDGDDVVLDTNHPLAGKTLHFDVEVLSTREASETEIAHGHVHSGGSCSH